MNADDHYMINNSDAQQLQSLVVATANDLASPHLSDADRSYLMDMHKAAQTKLNTLPS